tara:strand:- start:2201 stop:2551 length:351 start_codon:yes stop_codon:yes gene_type:complete
MLLFLKSEGYFSRDDFNEFNSLLSWDKTRFEKLRKDGWVEKFRNRVGKRKALYMLSSKGNNIVNLIYKKLAGQELPTSPSKNPMFRKNVSFTDKVYRTAIKKMNESIRQQQYRAAE